MQFIQHFPVTVFDNFFDDPDKIRTWALQQEYFPDPEGRFPGMRTKPLHKLDNAFFQMTCRKFFSQFYNVYDEAIEWDVSMNFQVVDGKYDSGWVHSDEVSAQITGIIYLTPNSNLNGGTSIFQEKKQTIQHTHKNLKYKEASYLHQMSIEDAKPYKNEHNIQYEETIRISNVYNRLICFDSHLHHSAQDFFGKDDESRLTLVFFVNKLLVNNTPVSRVRRITA